MLYEEFRQMRIADFCDRPVSRGILEGLVDMSGQAPCQLLAPSRGIADTCASAAEYSSPEMLRSAQ